MTDPTPGRPDAGAGGSQPLTMRQRRRLQPSRTAQLLAALAVSNLPPPHRTRYTLEFLAEIHGMRRPAQTSYAAALLLHSCTLGAALTEPDPANAKESAMKKGIRCRLGFHRYVRKVNPEAVGAFKSVLPRVPPMRALPRHRPHDRQLTPTTSTLGDVRASARRSGRHADREYFPSGPGD